MYKSQLTKSQLVYLCLEYNGALAIVAICDFANRDRLVHCDTDTTYRICVFFDRIAACLREPAVAKSLYSLHGQISETAIQISTESPYTLVRSFTFLKNSECVLARYRRHGSFDLVNELTAS